MQQLMYVGPHDGGVIVPLVAFANDDPDGIVYPGQVIEVDDDAFVHMADQPDNWEPQGASRTFLRGVLDFATAVWSERRADRLKRGGHTYAEIDGQLANFDRIGGRLTDLVGSPEKPAESSKERQAREKAEREAAQAAEAEAAAAAASAATTGADTSADKAGE